MVVLFSNNIFKFLENIPLCKILPKLLLFYNFIFYFKIKENVQYIFLIFKGEFVDF